MMKCPLKASIIMAFALLQVGAMSVSLFSGQTAWFTVRTDIEEYWTNPGSANHNLWLGSSSGYGPGWWHQADIASAFTLTYRQTVTITATPRSFGNAANKTLRVEIRNTAPPIPNQLGGVAAYQFVVTDPPTTYTQSFVLDPGTYYLHQWMHWPTAQGAFQGGESDVSIAFGVATGLNGHFWGNQSNSVIGKFWSPGPQTLSMTVPGWGCIGGESAIFQLNGPTSWSRTVTPTTGNGTTTHPAEQGLYEILLNGNSPHCSSLDIQGSQKFVQTTSRFVDGMINAPDSGGTIGWEVNWLFQHPSAIIPHSYPGSTFDGTSVRHQTTRIVTDQNQGVTTNIRNFISGGPGSNTNHVYPNGDFANGFWVDVTFPDQRAETTISPSAGFIYTDRPELTWHHSTNDNHTYWVRLGTVTASGVVNFVDQNFGTATTYQFPYKVRSETEFEWEVETRSPVWPNAMKKKGRFTVRPKPYAPGNPTVQSRTPETITWSWTAGEGAEEYLVRDLSGNELTPPAFQNLQWTENGLLTNTQYSRRFLSRNAFGESEGENQTAAYTAIEPPSGVKNTVSSSTILAFEITPPLSNLASGLSGVEIELMNEAGAGPKSGWIKSQVNSIGQLLPNTTYQVFARTRNGDGVETAFVMVGATATLATAAEGFGFHASTSEISLTWSAPENPIDTLYEAAISTDSGFVVKHTSTTIGRNALIGSLEPNTTYFVNIRSINRNQIVSPSSTSIAVTAAISPINFRLDSHGPENMTISWEDGGNPNGAQYRLQVSSSSNFSSMTHDLILSSKTAAISGLAANTSYYYKVRGRNWSGQESPEKSIISTVTLPNSALWNSFGNIDQNSIDVRWGLNGNPADTQFNVEISSFSDFRSFINTSGWITGTHHVVSGLLSNTTHYSRVKAKNRLNAEGEVLILGATATHAASPEPGIVIGGYDDSIGYFVRIQPSFGINPTDTELAIEEMDQNQISKGYLQGNGTTGVTKKWMTKEQWESEAIMNVVAALSGETTYRFRVHARNRYGIINPVPSVTVSEITPPNQPNAPTITEVGDAFLAVDVAIRSGISHYELWTSSSIGSPTSQYVKIASISANLPTYLDDVDGGSPNAPVIQLPAVNTNSISLDWSVPTVPPSVSRFYRVAAVDDRGRAGQKSGVGNGPSQVTPTIKEYGLFRNGIFLSTTNNRSYMDQNLVPNTSYTYLVHGVSNENKIGSPGQSSTFTNASVPVKPAFGLVTSSTVKIIVQHGENPPYTEYAVYNVENGGYVRFDGTLQASPTFFQIASGLDHLFLDDDTPYTYRIRARSKVGIVTGFGPDSDVVYTLAKPPLLQSLRHEEGRWNNNRQIQMTASQPDHFHYMVDENPISFPGESEPRWDGLDLFPDLLNEGTWYFHVAGHNAQHVNSGYVHFGPILIDTSAPTDIDNFSLSASTSGAVTIDIASSRDLLSGVSYYYLEKWDKDLIQIDQVNYSSGPRINILGLNPNTLYQFRVRAGDRAGNASNLTDFKSIHTLANQPTFAASVTVSDTVLNVTWGNAANPPKTRYRAEISMDPSFSNPISSITSKLSATFNSIAYDATAYVRVQAINEEGSSTPFLFFPPKPTSNGLILLNSSPNIYISSLTIAWQPASDPGSQYQVDYSSAPDWASYRSSAWMAELSTSVGNLTPNASHYVRIRSRNSDQETSQVQYFQVMATLARIPDIGAPTLALSTSEIRVFWNTNGNSPDTEYQCSVYSDMGFLNEVYRTPWTAAADHMVSNLEPDKVYWPKVRARNRGGIITAEVLLSSRSTLAASPIVTSDPGPKTWIADNKISASASGSGRFRVILSTELTPPAFETMTAWDGSLKEFEMPRDGHWYLHIQSFNQENADSGSNVFGPYYRDSTPPSQVSLLQPAFGTQIDVTSPLFKWADSVDANPIRYRLEVSSLPLFEIPIIIKTGLVQNEYVPLFDESLSDSTTYYWRVKPFDALHNNGQISSTGVFTVNLGDMRVLARETIDMNDDGAGDGIRLVFNVPFLDTTIISDEFEIIVLGNSKPALRVQKTWPGRETDPRVLYVMSESTFSPSVEPFIVYRGNEVLSVSGKKMAAEIEPVKASDRIGPSILRAAAVDMEQGKKSLISVQLAEEVPPSEAMDENRWQLLDSGGTALVKRHLSYDPGTRTIMILADHPSAKIDGAKIVGSGLHDDKGNLRGQTEARIRGMAVGDPTAKSGISGDRYPQGRGVRANSAVGLKFDRSMDVASLSQGMRLMLLQDSRGVLVQRKIPGRIDFSTTTFDARFLANEGLQKGCQYEVQVDSSVIDRFGFALGEPIKWGFETVADHTQQTVFRPAKGMKVTMSPGTFNEDASIVVNTLASEAAKLTSPSTILRATELAKKVSYATGKAELYPLESLFLEIYGVTPDGRILQGALNNAVEIELTYEDANQDGLVDTSEPPIEESKLKMYFLDENVQEFVKLPNSFVDPVKNTVNVSIRHFSVYGVMGSADTSVDSITVGPNPWKIYEDPLPLIIDKLPTGTDLKIYTVTGQLVKKISSGDGSGRMQWDGSNSDGEPVGSGVYILHLTQGARSKRVKVTVIR